MTYIDDKVIVMFYCIDLMLFLIMLYCFHLHFRVRQLEGIDMEKIYLGLNDKRCK